MFDNSKTTRAKKQEAIVGRAAPKPAEKYSPFLATVAEVLQELRATFSVDGELFTPPETDKEGDE
jgi:hypothetical protein